MANYDPKRNRPAAVVTEDDVAPIDAILGAVDAAPVKIEPPEVQTPEVETPEVETPEPTVDLREPLEAESDPDVRAEPIPAEAPRLAGSPIEVVPGPDRTTQRIAIVAGMAAATTALIVLWRRRQR